MNAVVCRYDALIKRSVRIERLVTASSSKRSLSSVIKIFLDARDCPTLGRWTATVWYEEKQIYFSHTHKLFTVCDVIIIIKSHTREHSGRYFIFIYWQNQ